MAYLIKGRGLQPLICTFWSNSEVMTFKVKATKQYAYVDPDHYVNTAFYNHHVFQVSSLKQTTVV